MTPSRPVEKAIGLDYGTSTTQVSYLASAGLPDLYRIGSGPGYAAYSVRSILAVHPDTDQILVGDDAASVPPPWVVLPSLKRCIPCSFDKRTGAGTCSNPQNQLLCAGLATYTIGSRTWSVEELIARFLGQIAQRTEVSHVDELHFSIPPSYSDKHVACVRSAASNAYSPRRVLPAHHEPTSALVALQTDTRFPSGLHVVVDVGGGTTDVVAMELVDKRFEIHPATSIFIAGDDFDLELFTFFRTMIPAGEASDYELRGACRVAKEQLTTASQTSVMGRRLTRTELDEILWEVVTLLVGQIKEYIERRVQEFARITSVDVLHVHLVGGGSRLPVLAAKLRAMQIRLVRDLHVMTVTGSGISEVYAEDLAVFCVALGNLLRPEDINLSVLPARLRVLESGRQIKVIDAHTPFPVHLSVNYDGRVDVIAEMGREELDLLRDAVPTLPPLRSYRAGAVGLRPLSARAIIDEANSVTIHITSGGFMFVRTARRDRWFEAPWKNSVDELRRQDEIEAKRRGLGYPDSSASP